MLKRFVIKRLIDLLYDILCGEESVKIYYFRRMFLHCGLDVYQLVV